MPSPTSSVSPAVAPPQNQQEALVALEAPVSSTGGNIIGEVKFIKWLSVGVSVVVAVAFIGMVFTIFGIIQQYISTQTTSYQSLVDKVNEQNYKIDLLSQKLDYYKTIQEVKSVPSKTIK